MLAKDCITVQEVCENTPLHKAIEGGELPSVQILLNFELYLSEDAQQLIKTNKMEEQVHELKLEMVRSRNKNLTTPLMLSMSQSDKIEIFIYILHSFEQLHVNRGLEAIDIQGNSVLHLAAKNVQHNNCIHFTKIIQRFSSTIFKRLLNLHNNDGLTPLFVAIEHRNLKMIKYLMGGNP